MTALLRTTSFIAHNPLYVRRRSKKWRGRAIGKFWLGTLREVGLARSRSWHAVDAAGAKEKGVLDERAVTSFAEGQRVRIDYFTNITNW